ncbi:MAG: SIS domain-containing protein [Pseudomonadota bacterium]
MTHPSASLMAREIEEMQAAAARLTGPAAQAQIREVARDLRTFDPPVLLTVARGSSDHAATYLSYATHLTLGRPVASVGPSIVSIYKTQLRTNGLAALAISQSGASADTARLCTALSESGGHVIALTNAPESALARASDAVIDIRAGAERAVAATKSFFNSVVAGLWLLAHWAEDKALLKALETLPADMERQRQPLWTGELTAALETAERAMVLARGPGLGLAHEIALKLIETCRIHASSYSGAEVLHGPSALLTDGYPVIALTGGAAHGMDQALERITHQGARLITIPEAPAGIHPLIAPLLDLQPIYLCVEALARHRGFDPDNPAHLQKETKTV